MTQPISFDPICGCPIERLVANRRDRRTAMRRGVVPATLVTRHRRTCPRAGAGLVIRSDPERAKPRGTP